MSDARWDATPNSAERSAHPAPATQAVARSRTGAVLSAGVLAAAVAALAAPSVTASPQTTWAMPSNDPVAVQPLAASAEDRFAAMQRSARSGERAALPSTREDALPTIGADALPITGEAADSPATADVETDLEPAPEPDPEPEVVGKRYATTELNVRTKPDMDSKVVATLGFADKVKITDVTDGEWRQIVYKDEVRWVKKEFLAKSKPDPKPAGPSDAACASGSGVEGGLAANTVAVHRAVCNAFPSVGSYGGRRGSGGNHGSGHALDIMVSGSAGDAIAAYVRSHAGELGVSEIIWSQRIWTVQRGGEGWRSMSDRGSATANHYDHVHVSTY